MPRKNRGRGNGRRKPPKVPGLLIDEGIDERGFRFKVLYDCPWCGHEHRVELNDNPPVIVTPDCGRGKVNLHRVEEPAQGNENEDDTDE